MSTFCIKVQVTLGGKALIIHDFVVNDGDTLSIPIDVFISKEALTNAIEKSKT